MHDAAVTVVVALGAFLGTMIDNFFAYAAQLSVSDPRRVARAAYGHAAGVLTLIALSVAAGSVLSAVPLRAVGLLAAGPLALAVYAWRHRRDPRAPVRRGATTTWLITVTLGGDNLAVWTPLFRANGVARGVLTVVVFALGEVVLLFLARAMASRPAVIATGQRVGPLATPLLYVALAVVIVWQCHWF